jgi:hypothetical protein
MKTREEVLRDLTLLVAHELDPEKAGLTLKQAKAVLREAQSLLVLPTTVEGTWYFTFSDDGYEDEEGLVLVYICSQALRDRADGPYPDWDTNAEIREELGARYARLGLQGQCQESLFEVTGSGWSEVKARFLEAGFIFENLHDSSEPTG